MPTPFMRHIPSSRSACACAALLCFAAAFVLTPTGVRSQLTAAPDASPLAQPAISPPPILAVVPQRDAYMPRVRVGDDPPAGSERARVLPAVPRDLAPRPQIAATAGARVTAIAIGAQSSAIVDVDGTSHVVSVGDRISHARVTAIESTAVDLDNGTRLQLTSDSAAP